MDNSKDINDPNSVAYRIEQCKNCEMMSRAKFCAKCGCFMPAKVRFKSSECPIGKWFAIIPVERI